VASGLEIDHFLTLSDTSHTRTRARTHRDTQEARASACEARNGLFPDLVGPVTHAHKNARTHAHAHTYSVTHAHTGLGSEARNGPVLSDTHTHTRARAHTRAHTRTNRKLSARLRASTHARTHARTREEQALRLRLSGAVPSAQARPGPTRPGRQYNPIQMDRKAHNGRQTVAGCAARRPM
jgi:hypothetical protein